MKPFALFSFLLISLSTFAQEHVIFERNEKTEQLFDESNPLSFISILQQNADFFQHYEIHGMDSKVYENLSSSETKSTFVYIGKMSDVPLVDEYGESVILILPDGTQSYVYPAPDSFFIDLYEIDRIEFTLFDGDEEPMQRLNELRLWKEYSSGMQRVLTLDAKVFMKFNGISFILPVSENLTQKLTAKSDDATLWSTIRDSSLHQMKWFEDRMTNGVFNESDGYASNYVQSYFPSLWLLDYRSDNTWLQGLDLEPHFSPYYEYERVHPFSFEFSHSVLNSEIDAATIQKKFNAAHSILTQSDYELVDEYGDPLIQLNDDGTEEFVYEAPKEEYFFLDYEPTIFVSKQVVCDSSMNCSIIPKMLLFCLKSENENTKPEIISNLTMDFENDWVDRSYLEPFLRDFQTKDLWSTPEFSFIKSIINNKKYRKTLSFEESTIPCEPCANKKKKYALCWKGKRKTKYQFTQIPVQLKDGSFLAKKGNNTYLLDPKGNELFSAELDSVHTAKEYEGTYFGQKGNYWMIYSTSGEYSLPMTYITDGYDEFKLHNFLQTRLDGKYFVSVGKNGKKGLIDIQGNVLLPYEFVELYADSTSGYNGDEWITLTRVVGKINMENDWTIYGPDFHPQGTISAGKYFGTYGDFYLFTSGKQMDAYHSITLSKDPTIFSSTTETHVFKENKKGIVNDKGILIIPAKYNYIRRKSFSDQDYFFCTTHEYRLDIYDTLGNEIGSFDNVDYYNLICADDPNLYTIVSQDYKTKIIQYDEESRAFTLLFDSNFLSITCNSTKSEKAFATGVIRNAEESKKYILFRDGRMELVEE